MVMAPEAFWPLTPVECGEMIQGAAGREERAWERAAFLGALIMNVSGKSLKKPVTPAQLLGRKGPIVPKDPGAELEALRARALELAKKMED